MDISSMLEVQVNEVKEIDSKENVTPKELVPNLTNVPAHVSEEEYSFYKLMFGNDISAVRFQRLHCTACDAHIGSAPTDVHNMFEHPILRTLLCSKCRDFYGDGIFEQGDDATDMFCRWCANGGNLYCCSFCSNTFCSKCIKRNFDPLLRKKIEADEKWKCFVCNPRDLYPARGTCWALLQHVQSMNRLLQNNQKMTQEELDEKMNADESNCCSRRKRRKRRRNGSNSEEDDTTYLPKQIVPNVVAKRRKKGRGRPRLANGSNVSMEEKAPSGISEETALDQNEILPSLLSCEQTMVECENATVSGDGRIISQNHSSPVYRKVNPSGCQQPATFSTPIMNIVPAPNFLSSVSPIVPVRHLPNSINLYQTPHTASMPMVTIPNQSVTILSRSHMAKADVRGPALIAPKPSVIEIIESDPEDLSVADTSKTQRSTKNASSTSRVVPVALVSSKNNYNFVRRQELQDRRKTLNQRLLPHGKEVDQVLVNLRKKFQGWFEMSKQEELRGYEVSDARRLIKQLHREVRDTVTQLAYINDRIVREYNRWKKYHVRPEANQSPGRTAAATEKTKCEDIPLEMTCTNESDSEVDTDGDLEYSIMNPSELLGATNAVDGIKFFKVKNTIDRGVGDGPALFVDKSVQICDAELQDYDRCIRRNALQVVKKRYERTKKAKQTANYEKCFIKFLQSQSIRVQEEEPNRPEPLPDPNETSLKDLIEANSPFVSKMLETMDKTVTPSRSNPTISIRKESDLKPPAQQQLVNSIVCRPVNELVKIVDDEAVNDSTKKTVSDETKNSNHSQKEDERPKTHCLPSDKISVTNELKSGEEDPNRVNTIDLDGSNEDDCTIIDD